MNTTTTRRPELARARRQTTARTTRSTRTARRPLRPYVVPTAAAQQERVIGLLRLAAALLLQPRPDMLENGRVAGEIVSYLENSRRA